MTSSLAPAQDQPRPQQPDPQHPRPLRPDPHQPGQNRLRQLPRILAEVLFLVALVAQIVVAWRFWSLTWDDSAITLGFSRTLAFTGSIQPTPNSGIVEGYSTTLWMLLMAAAARLVQTPAALLITAKLATLALNLLNLFLLRAWLTTWMPALLATLAAGIFGSSFMFYETINGMETPLLLTLILTLFLLHTRPGRAARLATLAAGIALILTRWEAIWYLIPFLLFERPRSRAITSASIWAGAFLLMNLVRRSYFGSFLPNTIIAKQGEPYLAPGSPLHQLHLHLAQAKLIAVQALPFALAIALFLLLRFLIDRQPPTPGARTISLRPPALYLTSVFVLFAIALTVGIGKNWGPELRSFYSGWPFLLALLVFPLAPAVATPRYRIPLTLTIALLCLASAAKMRHLVQELRAPYAPVYMPDATVDQVNQTTSVLTAIQQATGRHDLLFAGPDMGAILLFSNGIRIIDLGLLCDKTLARERFPAVETYVLQQRKPDIIEVHGLWIPLTRLATSTRFHQDYRPVVITGRRIFLRRDLLTAIPPARLHELPFSPDQDFAIHTDRQINPEDAALNQTFGTYLQLD